MSEDTPPKQRGRSPGSKNRALRRRAIVNAERTAQKKADKAARATVVAIERASGVTAPPPKRQSYAVRHIPMCPHCQHPLDRRYTVDDVRDELEGNTVLENIPHVYEHESPVRLAAHLSRGLSMLFGVPPAMFRSAFLEELAGILRHLHPNFRCSAARACLEGRLTETAPFVEVRPGVRNRMNRVLEVLDLLQSLAVLKKSTRMRDAYAKEAEKYSPQKKGSDAPGFAPPAAEGDSPRPPQKKTAGPPRLCEVSVSSYCAFCRCGELDEGASGCPWCGSSVHLSPPVNADRLRLYRDAGKIVMSAHGGGAGYDDKFWCLVCAWSGSLGEHERERCPHCLQKNGDDFLEANLRWQQMRRLTEERETRAAKLALEAAQAAEPAPAAEVVEDPNPIPDPKEEETEEAVQPAIADGAETDG